MRSLCLGGPFLVLQFVNEIRFEFHPKLNKAAMIASLQFWSMNNLSAIKSLTMRSVPNGMSLFLFFFKRLRVTSHTPEYDNAYLSAVSY
ncbi:hypothetical protein M467_13030 [Exiguobacterium chiriqhucha RW-2]|uniref:Uncharacterized protein n=1 Tax=Exiguobacterium chiriqhucha RW-2 TaxID=1345023 RepID=U1LZM0_9BACL|nr:hypothetical protein M467_13030 [Exiguobacterium chiriqhucha RW-2]